ncbi:MAG: TGS domain-containing protein, partial [Candidatus Atribacteria bacterium]|nr:TGS domain-containing protein [Candidatus Atribacteria bacterium]
MSRIKVILLDGSEIELNKDVTLYDAALKISQKFAKEAIAGIVNGVKKDLNYTLKNNDRIEILTFAS